MAEVKKVPLIRVGVLRDGKTVYPEIGKPFHFTEGEVSDLQKLSEAAGQDYLREPVNETEDEPVEKKPAAGKTKKVDEAL